MGSAHWLVWGLIALGGSGILLGLWLVFWPGLQLALTDSAPSSSTVKSQGLKSLGKSEEKPLQKFGHFRYAIAPQSQLELVLPGQTITLQKNAAVAFRQLVTAAAKDGVSITLISGFRDHASQDYLFYDVMQERGQTPQQRAEVSAPPGFSEHHTGYAVDIGDAQAPSTSLSPSFGETTAFAWMQKHAAQYHWELSFPPQNPQGVNYEPWHWRYIGDRESIATFSIARNQDLSTQKKRP